MFYKKVRKMLALMMCAAMCAGLTACGGGGDTAKGTEGGGASSAEQETEKKDDKASAGDLSNTLVYAGESEDTINPLLNTHDELPNIIFSGLLKYDGEGNPVEDLAESYEFDKDSLTYTFHLRDGVKWHDGEAFSADDVVFTYTALTEDETLSSSVTTNYEDIAEVAAPDEKTVTIKMSRYNAAMPGYFTIGILPKHLVENEDLNTTSFNQNPVGTGRYKFVSWEKDGGMINLERNEDYYGTVPQIEKIIYKTVSVESTKATMLQSGEADLAWLNSNYADTFRGKDGYKNIDFQTADYRAMSMDFRTEFWQENGDSIAVLNYALDKDSIVKSVLAGHGVAAYSPIQLNPYGGNEDADMYPYDLDKFASEMKKLGWKKGDDGIYERNGEKFHFTIQVRDYEEERVDIANICSSQLKQAGVDMEVVLVTRFDWESGYNGFLSGYATQFDPDMIYANYVTGASDNNMQYSNEKVDEILEKARHTEDTEERKELYHQFELEYMKNPGIVPVAFLEGNYVSIEGLDGLDTTRLLGHHAVGVFWNVEEWTLNK
ncbi:MAG: ABC transporter substrate-binding protein [Lachnospiraceae bacterium]|nr:ABC transporter substrate-binding protein [Lachnospiraceae bacterium]